MSTFANTEETEVFETLEGLMFYSIKHEYLSFVC